MSPLETRDVNLPVEAAGTEPEKKAISGSENKSLTMESTLYKKMPDFKTQQSGAYVSPSDAIQSPASKKLAGFKQRQINRQTDSKRPAARTLFARTASACEAAEKQT